MLLGKANDCNQLVQMCKPHTLGIWNRVVAMVWNFVFIDMGSSFDDTELDDLRSENKRLEIKMKSLHQRVDKMEQQLGSKENQLGMKDRQLSAKDREISILKGDLQKMTVRANQAERKFLDLQGKPRVGH